MLDAWYRRVACLTSQQFRTPRSEGRLPMSLVRSQPRTRAVSYKDFAPTELPAGPQFPMAGCSIHVSEGNPATETFSEGKRHIGATQRGTMYLFDHFLAIFLRQRQDSDILAPLMTASCF